MALPDEIVEEVLLRFPPDDPASLVRAALVCKPWCRLVSRPGFRRRFRELHRTPPLLGFCYLCRNAAAAHDVYSARFVPAASFRRLRAEHRGWGAADSRHGRVLLYRCRGPFVVWDPITDEQQQLPPPPALPPQSWISWNAAVLCAGAGAGACDHLDCHRGHFDIVFVCTVSPEMFLYIYSSEAAAWSQPASPPHHGEFVAMTGSAVAGNALHFLIDSGSKIFKYELGTKEISLIQGPPESSYRWPIVLITTEDGMLGFATLLESGLHLWSREVSRDGGARWTPSRVIAPQALLPFNNTLSRSPRVMGFADGVRVIFLWSSDDGLFIVDLRSGQTRKACGDRNIATHHVVPYMSFYTPALQVAPTGQGPNRGVSNA